MADTGAQPGSPQVLLQAALELKAFHEHHGRGARPPARRGAGRGGAAPNVGPFQTQKDP